MFKLLFVCCWLLYANNINIYSISLDQATELLHNAKNLRLIKPDMASYNQITNTEILNLRRAVFIKEEDVRLGSLMNLRAFCNSALRAFLPPQDVAVVSANAHIEFEVLSQIIKHGYLPNLKDVPPHVLEYIKSLEEKRIAAQNELKRAQRVALMPADQLDHSPQFSPARPRNDITVYLQNQSNGGLVNTPERSRALFPGREDGTATLTMMSRFANSPENTVQQTPVDRRILHIRREQEARLREQNALMSEAQRRAMEAEEDRQAQYERAVEAERQRNALCHAINSHAVVVDSAGVELLTALGSIAECLQYHSEIVPILRLLQSKSDQMQGNIQHLKEINANLSILKSKVQSTLESVKTISSAFHSGDF